VTGPFPAARRAPIDVPILLTATVAFAVFLAAAPPWPDDWDGLGFLASIRHFDLDAFAPHPPGYPVYVALLKLARLAAPNPLAAAQGVAALSGALTVGFVAATFRRAAGASSSASALVGLAAVATPLGFHCATVVGSEAPALALTSLALYGLAAEKRQTTHAVESRGSPAAVGIGVGLGLGTRISWAPLLLMLLVLVPRPGRRMAWSTAAGATLAWGVPFVRTVGPLHLAHLLDIHLSGHATRWGGTALTEPSRALFLARDLFVDGLGVDRDALGVAVGALLLVAAVFALDTWRRAGWSGLGPIALTTAPYLVWIAVGQNLREQPRHVLPLVALLSTGLGASAWFDRHARWSCLALFALVGCRTGSDAYARTRDPPPGAALVSYVRSLPHATRVVVFGVSSVRFFEGTELAAQALGAETLGDISMGLARARVFPERAFMTSEIAERERPPTATWVRAFCRPARLDRKHPCLDLFEIEPDAGRSY
jgi:hypothetical protein